jgi:hypothetical protein
MQLCYDTIQGLAIFHLFGEAKECKRAKTWIHVRKRQTRGNETKVSMQPRVKEGTQHYEVGKRVEGSDTWGRVTASNRIPDIQGM